MEWGFTITNLLCCSHFIFFLWVLTTCKFLIYCFRSFLFIVSWSSIKQTLIAAVTAKLFVKLIADPTLCQTGGVSVHWAPDRCQLHILCALMRAVFLAAIQRGSLQLQSLLLFFAQLPPLVELLAALSWTVALAVVIAWVCRSFRFSSSFFLGSWQLDRFVVDGYAVVCGFIGNWFIGCVLFPVGKGGEQGAVSSIKIYIWFAVYA